MSIRSLLIRIRQVRALLSKMRRARAEARAQEKSSLQGMFGRGELYDAPSLEAAAARDEAERAIAKEREGERSVEDCEREAAEAEQLIASLRERGKLDEAAALEQKVGEHKRQLDGYKSARARQASAPPPIDFRNPTEAQLRDAQARRHAPLPALLAADHRMLPPPPSCGRSTASTCVTRSWCRRRPPAHGKTSPRGHSSAFLL